MWTNDDILYAMFMMCLEKDFAVEEFEGWINRGHPYFTDDKEARYSEGFRQIKFRFVENK